MQGGNAQIFERGGLGEKLQTATTTTITGLDRVTGRISGVLTGTGKTSSHAYNKALAKLAQGDTDVDAGVAFITNSVKAMLEVAGYNAEQILAAETR